MRNGHIQSAKTELKRLQKQGNTAANRSVVEQRADHGATDGTIVMADGCKIRLSDIVDLSCKF